MTKRKPKPPKVWHGVLFGAQQGITEPWVSIWDEKEIPEILRLYKGVHVVITEVKP